jgi:hypothetical protein
MGAASKLYVPGVAISPTGANWKFHAGRSRVTFPAFTWSSAL